MPTASSEQHRFQYSPFELHRFDVEAQRGADCADILSIQALHNCSLPSIVQAPA